MAFFAPSFFAEALETLAEWEAERSSLVDAVTTDVAVEAVV